MTTVSYRYAAIILAVLALVFSCYLQFLDGNAGDKDWLLYAAGMLLKGKKLDVDIIEINPPLILWLYTAPAYIVQKTGITDSHALVSLGLCLVAFSISLCVRLADWHPAFAHNNKQKAMLALLLAFVFIFRTDPSYFLDRDHIFLVMTLPYIFRWLPPLARASIPLRLRIILAMMAAIGFCVKPHCLIVFAGIQLLYLLRERTGAILISIENLIIYIGISLYMSCIWLWVPDYIYTVFPMALATYGAFARRADGLLYCSGALFTLAISFCEFRLRHASPYRGDIYYLTGLCFFFLCYALCNNGWGYAYNPLSSYVLITTGWLFWEFTYLKGNPRTRINRQGRLQMASMPVLPPLVCMVHFTCLL
jgi:hypothetical protein